MQNADIRSNNYSKRASLFNNIQQYLERKHPYNVQNCIILHFGIRMITCKNIFNCKITTVIRKEITGKCFQ